MFSHNIVLFPITSALNFFIHHTFKPPSKLQKESEEKDTKSFFLYERLGEYFLDPSSLLCLSVYLYNAQPFCSCGKCQYASNI